MRVLITGIALISLSFLTLPVPVPAFAQEVCRCQGCGCKGGPGWRGPEGTCVSKAKLAEICGSPPGAPCNQEAAARVCLGNETAGLEPKVKAETP
ncbi:MAG TPA: hypothetical protein VNO69_02875 [Methyloceanibacter sp.]|nr:hypothetical protein [Methyloceanibacter sp.]